MYITAINDEFEDNFKFLNNAINYIEQSSCVEREREKKDVRSAFSPGNYYFKMKKKKKKKTNKLIHAKL